MKGDCYRCKNTHFHLLRITIDGSRVKATILFRRKVNTFFQNRKILRYYLRSKLQSNIKNKANIKLRQRLILHKKTNL